ncbi:GlcG/HbpS family heme-binding protein [Marinospirillum alkaliphilum]|uniref:Uncharacterized conserved protein GlcG, DUF336 family n=1 Tax=Marinospirillum alkaliphilum DSM 21637 TaxID=1122209 RepID=A0A1K1V0X9_9GAMM|nr:heme-binding protein [Marinospirillum alkaliphilum]SFX18754.1 Uncharacterized conserved protein GlcG, DUF336 family [Marinospirillum alkaliphilum DSM 21637]
MTVLLQQWSSLSLSAARQLADHLLLQAEQQGVQVALAVVDRAGVPLVRIKMDLAPAPSQDIALRKATTALAFGMATDGWDARLQQASQGVRQGLPLQDGLALFGGGVPLVVDQQPVGAVGVSGASEVQDTALARQAATFLKQLLG